MSHSSKQEQRKPWQQHSMMCSFQKRWWSCGPISLVVRAYSSLFIISAQFLSLICLVKNLWHQLCRMVDICSFFGPKMFCLRTRIIAANQLQFISTWIICEVYGICDVCAYTCHNPCQTQPHGFWATSDEHICQCHNLAIRAKTR